MVTFFSGSEAPVFLLTVFAKNERSNLSKAERNALARLAQTLLAEYRRETTGAARRKR